MTLPTTSPRVETVAPARGWLALPPALAFLVSVFASGVPAFSIDESATITASSRSIQELWSMLGNIDAVHGLYYLLMHPILSWFGPSEIALRMSSAAFISLAAAGVTVLGFRMRGFGVALAAGITFALLPVTSYYGMEARSLALTAALAVWATYCLVRAIDVEASPRIWWVIYTCLMILTVWVFIFAALLLVAHAVTLVFTGRHRWWVGFGWSAAIVMAAAIPLLFVLANQVGQVNWIPPLSLDTVRGALSAGVLGIPGRRGLDFDGAAWLVVALWFVVAFGLWSTLRQATISAGMRRFMSVVLPWAMLPTALILAASLFDPLFAPRYVFFSGPAFALLVAHGLMAIRRRWIIAVVTVVLLVLAAPAWIADRQQDNKSGIRSIVEIWEEDTLPGDAVVFVPGLHRRVVDTYPESFAPLYDVALKRPSLEADNLWGEDVTRAELTERLAGVDRVWVVFFSKKSTTKPWLRSRLKEDFTETETWIFDQGKLKLFTRDAGPVDSE